MIPIEEAISQTPKPAQKEREVKPNSKLVTLSLSTACQAKESRFECPQRASKEYSLNPSLISGLFLFSKPYTLNRLIQGYWALWVWVRGLRVGASLQYRALVVEGMSCTAPASCKLKRYLNMGALTVRVLGYTLVLITSMSSFEE